MSAPSGPAEQKRCRTWAPELQPARRSIPQTHSIYENDFTPARPPAAESSFAVAGCGSSLSCAIRVGRRILRNEAVCCASSLINGNGCWECCFNRLRFGVLRMRAETIQEDHAPGGGRTP